LAKAADRRYASAAEFARVIDAAYVQLFNSAPSRTISEDTVQMSQQVRMRRTSGLLDPSGQSPQSIGSTDPNWRDPAALKTVERELAKFIGPVARVLVRKAAEKTSDRHSLYVLLAESVDDRSRPSFLATEGRTDLRSAAVDHLSQALTVGPIVFNDADMQPGEMISQRDAEEARRLLAARVGPIAGLCIKQAAKQAKGRADFFALLANNLPQGSERDAFLRDLARAGL